jgi:hypothetical protein
LFVWFFFCFFCFHQYYLILAVSIIGKRCLFLFIVTSLAVRQKNETPNSREQDKLKNTKKSPASEGSKN